MGKNSSVLWQNYIRIPIEILGFDSGVIASVAQGFFLALSSRLTLGSARGLYEVLGIEPGSARCNASTYCAITPAPQLRCFKTDS